MLKTTRNIPISHKVLTKKSDTSICVYVYTGNWNRKWNRVITVSQPKPFVLSLKGGITVLNMFVQWRGGGKLK